MTQNKLLTLQKQQQECPMMKKGYTETGLLRVGWCVLDDDDNVLGYARMPEDYAEIMNGREYASAAPMFIKIE